MTAHRKADAERKEVPLTVRVTTEQRERFEAAANRAGLELSAWLRMVALRAAAWDARVLMLKEAANGRP